MNRAALSSVIAASLVLALSVCFMLALFVASTRSWSIPVSLGLVTFLAVLNGQLNGASKEKIDAVIGILALSLFGLAVYVHGWLTASGYLLACFLFGAVSVIIAVPLARSMMGRS